MKVSPGYYEPEVRDGYYISSEMKRCWAATIETLYEIDKVCRKYGLQYYADYGTLLGAIRHGGFIPWDDDLDICMKRDDYLRFLSVAEKELPKDYKLLSCYNNSEYRNFLSRVANNGFICMERDFLEKNHDFPFAVGVDIFPLDFVAEDEDTEVIRKLITTAQDIAHRIDEKSTYLYELGNDGLRIAELLADCGSTIEEGKPIRQQILILIDRLMAVFTEDESDKIAHMHFWATQGNHIYPKLCFETSIRVPFEFYSIPVPIGYDYLLSNDYGFNYMMPVRSGGMHEYPVYHKQKKVMYEVRNQYYYKEYTFEEADLSHDFVANNKRDRKEVVFLPFKSEYWNVFEPEWQKAMNDPDIDVYVIPIPYYRKGAMRFDEELCYDGDNFPEYVNVTGFDSYDFEKRKPDTIYICNPYDEYNEGITVHPRFYSNRMKEVCDRLVYIPYFTTDNYDNTDERSVLMSRYYIRMPGVTRADKVIVQSESIRQRYIEELSEFSGIDDKSVWGNRIQVADKWNKGEMIRGLYEEEVPEEWVRFLFSSDGSGKKIVLYYLNTGNIILRPKSYFEKMRKVIKLFEECKEKITLLWYEDVDTQYILESLHPDLWDEYLALLNEYLSNDIGIYDNSGNSYNAVMISDAYYGDRSPFMYKMRVLDKPIMIQNVDV